MNITANNIKLNNRSIAIITLFRNSQKNYRYPPDKHIDGQEIKNVRIKLAQAFFLVSEFKSQGYSRDPD